MHSSNEAKISSGLSELSPIPTADSTQFLLKSLGEQKKSDSFYEVGICHDSDPVKIKTTLSLLESLSIDRLEQASRSLHPEVKKQALSLLGRCYEDGLKGVNTDCDKAFQYYEMAQDGDGLLAIADKFNLRNRYHKAVHFLQRIIDNNKQLSSAVREAYFILGNYYKEGHGVNIDEKKARECYFNAANLKHSGAIAIAVVYCFEGIGIGGTKDVTLAKHFLELGIEIQDPDTLHLLGDFYAKGHECFPCNPQKAVQLYLQAAKLGHESASKKYYLLEIENLKRECKELMQKNVGGIKFVDEFKPEELVNKDHHQIGVGGQGDVYEGCYLQKPVAIKRILSDGSKVNRVYVPNVKELSYFVSELKVHLNINSPYIAKLVGFYEKPCLTIVTEFMSKGNLENFIHSHHDERAKIDTIMKWLLNIIDGLIALHAKQIIHLDFRTENILINDKDEAIIIDFCLSSKENEISRWAGAPGITPYRAPECLELDQKKITTKSDIYSFGVIVWQLFHWTSFKNRTRPKEDELEIPEEFPPSVSNLIKLCWTKDFQDRPTAEKVKEHLLNIKKQCEESKFDLTRIPKWSPPPSTREPTLFEIQFGKLSTQNLLEFLGAPKKSPHNSYEYDLVPDSEDMNNPTPPPAATTNKHFSPPF